MPAILGLSALFVGLVLILADQHLGRAVWRRAEEPDAGATTVRMLGAILFIAGGVAFLTWRP